MADSKITPVGTAPVTLHQHLSSSSSSSDEKLSIHGDSKAVATVDAKHADDGDSVGLGEGLEITMLGPPPTDEERATLRRVPAKIPYLALLIAFLELCERASYYGLTGESVPIKNPMSCHDRPG